MKAGDIITEASKCLVQRGVDYDSKGGERSMRRAVTLFNEVTNARLSVKHGWLMMIAVKLARMEQNPKKLDTYVDLCAYFALLGEEQTDET